MTMNFDRSTCCDLEKTISREWIVTNGLGGYAAGTVAGVLTRAQHGLLVAMSPNAAKPQLLLAKIDEEVYFDQRTYYLGTNEYRDGTFNPSGFVHLESFRLEDGFPVFTYHLSSLDGLVLEKRIWMAQGHNTTFIQYRALRTLPIEKTVHTKSHVSVPLNTSTGPLHEAAEEHPRLTLTLLPLTTSRPFDTLRHTKNKHGFQVHVHPPVEPEPGTLDHSLWQKKVSRGFAGCTIQTGEDTLPYHILAVSQQESETTFIPTGVWYWNFLHRCDKAAGLPCTDDLYLPGVVRAILSPDDNTVLTLVVSTEELLPQMYQPEMIRLLYKESAEHQHVLLHRALQPPRQHYDTDKTQTATGIHPLRFLPLSNTCSSPIDDQQYLQQLIDTNNKFLAHYSKLVTYQATNKLAQDSSERDLFFEHQEHYTTVLADYYTLTRRTRDTLIALPGLTLITGRYHEALYILRDIAKYFISGSLPDRLPDADHRLLDGDYQNADIALWYFYALDSYLQATHNYAFLEEIFPRLKECINRYVQGTRNGIRLDTNDGLLIAMRPGTALTWMNAYVDGKPVTRRAGKPVEVNALWYHALSLMYEWSQHLSYTGYPGQNGEYYYTLLTQCKESFQSRFWNTTQGYLYDVVDGPAGDDPALRVNQIFALSLRHPLLDARYHERILKVIARQLLTPYGLRTLAPNDDNYHGHCVMENSNALQLACHQGCAWPWLVGPYMDALVLLYSDRSLDHDAHLFQEYLWHEGLQLLAPFNERFQAGILGMCEAFFDGDSPHHPASPTVSALSTAELLRAYHLLGQLNIHLPEQMLSY